MIRNLLKEKGWTQADLALILGRPLPTVNEIIQGKRGVTPEMALALAGAFGVEAERWLELEGAYRLSQATTDPCDIQRRAKLYDLAPVREMARRGWIREWQSDAELEDRLARFFGIDVSVATPRLQVATRRNSLISELSPSQRAWCFRAKQLAGAVSAAQFNPKSLVQLRDRLRETAAYAQEARNISRVMASYGIRFVVVEPLQGSKIDGAAFWLDDDSPVIATSIRYDRIDAFWFTVMHELSHICHFDASLDDDMADLPSMAKEEPERRADEEAADWLIPSEKMQSFVLRVGPLYSKQRINQFAHRMKIHPGIIVGRLQYLGEIKYSANREMLVKVRDFVADSALTDGWGRIIGPDLI